MILPAGWAWTGVQKDSIGSSISVSVWMDPYEEKWISVHPFGGLSMIAEGGEAKLLGPDGHVYDSERYGMSVGPGRWSNSVSMGTSFGPVFLACTYSGPGNYTAPTYNTDCSINYSWFADRSTVVTHFIGEQVVTYPYIGGNPMGGGPSPDPLPEYANLGPLIGGIGANFSGAWPNVLDADFHITSINGASEVDFSGVDDYGKWSDYWIFGPGVHVWGEGNGLKIRGGSYGFIGAVHLGYPGFDFSYSGKITKFGQDAPDIVQVNDSILCSGDPNDAPHYDYLTFPAISGRSFHIPSFPFRVPGTKSIGGGGLSFSINIPWAQSQDPPLITDKNGDEAKIPVRGVLPSIGTTGFAPYYPVSIKVRKEIDVLRPDGQRPSEFKSKNTNRIIVTEESSRTKFDIRSDAPCSVEREFKAPWWRQQLEWFEKAKELARMNRGDEIASTYPNWNLTWYTHHKHMPDEDIWWWGMYGYLNIEMYSPVECDIMMRVDWTHLLVEDNHYDGLLRLLSMRIDPQGGYGMYKLHLRPGMNNLDVDLLFPTDMGGPVYPGRVDKVSFSGFPVDRDASGNLRTTIFILDTMKLKAKHAAYFKIGFGTQRHHNPALEQDDENYRKPDYSVPVISLDGAFGFGNIPDDAYKADEIGPYGGSPRYVDPQAGSSYLVSKHRQMGLAEFWSQLNAIEGIEARYDPNAFLAAFSDAYGNHWNPGVEMADWLHPVVPYVLLQPDVEYKPPCSPAAGAIGLPNMQEIEGHVDHTIYAGLEVLTHDAARKRRLGSGHEVRAIRLDTNDVVARAYTDDCGYAVLSPLPANEEVDYTLEWDA